MYKMLIRENLRAGFEITKDLSGVLSAFALVFGSLTLWFYLSSYGLLYLLSTDMELLTLLALFFAGYLVALMSITFSLTIIPIGIIGNIRDFIGESSHIALPSNLAPNIGIGRKIISSLRGLPILWFSVFINPFIISWLYLTGDNHHSLLYITLLFSYTIIYMVWITYHYQKYKLTVIKPLSEKFIFVIRSSALILINIFPLFIFLLFLSKSEYSNWVQYSLLIFLSVLYAIILASIAIQASNFNGKIYRFATIVMLLFVIGIHLIVNFAILNMTVSMVGIRENSQSVVYQFQSDKVDNSIDLANFSKESIKLSKDKSKVYIRGSSIFKFRKTLILCPKEVTREQVQKNRFLCFNASGLDYKEVSTSIFEKL